MRTQSRDFAAVHREEILIKYELRTRKKRIALCNRVKDNCADARAYAPRARVGNECMYM